MLMDKNDWKKDLIPFRHKEKLFRQGEAADVVYFLQEGHVKLTVLSKGGKEATIGILNAGDFVGEEAISGAVGIRLLSATALTDVKVYKIERSEMLRMMLNRPEFANFFVRFLLNKGARTQADLIDQLFNSSERRLARILLLMAEYGQPGEPSSLIPPVTQETLAEMIGTTRGRVSFFMNRFRKLGFVEYNGRIKVHRTLLNLVLHDTMPGDNASRPDSEAHEPHPDPYPDEEEVKAAELELAELHPRRAHAT